MGVSVRNRLHERFLTPLVVSMTALIWGESLLEALTYGAMRSPDSLSDMYLMLMGGYMAGIEVQKWTQKLPADPADDSWLERANRAGWILLLWWSLFMGIHLWRLHDETVPMPSTLKPLTSGMMLLFIGKRVSRHVRHTRRGVGGDGLDEDDNGVPDSASDAQVLDLLRGTPQGLTMLQIEEGLPDVSRTTIKRSLRDLLHGRYIVREGIPRSRDARYRCVAK